MAQSLKRAIQAVLQYDRAAIDRAGEAGKFSWDKIKSSLTRRSTPSGLDSQRQEIKRMNEQPSVRIQSPFSPMPKPHSNG
jgi:hypothetical protein